MGQKIRKPEFHRLIALFILTIGLFFSAGTSLSQGRLLRGEVWKEFNLTGTNADFFVSPKGNDSWSGKLADPNAAGTDGPFATIQQAQKAVRSLKSKVFTPKKPALDKRYIGSPHPYGSGKDILILIREGIYQIDSTLLFKPQDGGERVETELPTGAFEYHQLKDYYVTYASYPGELAVLSGGERITGWKKKGDRKWQVQFNRSEVKELFAGGQRQTLARSPNTGYFETDGQPTDPGLFRFRKGDLTDWKDLTSNHITMIVRWGAINSSLVKIDKRNRLAYLKTPDNELLNVPPKYYIENMESLLDTSGEWFFDQKTRLLSYIPPTGINDPNQAVILCPRTSGLIRAAGTREQPLRNLRLYNLTFSTTAPGGQSTLDFSYTKNCELLKNTIENVSQSAINFGVGSYHNLIDQNTIRNIRGSGIAVYGTPKPENWNDLVSDNTISRNEVANLRPAMVGIRTANAMRTTIARNYVTNTGSYGITAGSWPNVEETSDGSHTVEYNHLSYTNMARDDEGAIAVYGLSPGSVVRENLIHDVRPATTNENVGLFFQNMASGWSLTNNILYGLKQAEMKLCAAYLENNTYKENHLIERPTNEPEKIISGNPDYAFSELQVQSPEGLKTGTAILIKARVTNTGSTGNQPVSLYVDGKVADIQLFPVIANNSRTISFSHQFFNPGRHSIAIGTTAEQSVDVAGEAIRVLYSNLRTDALEAPLGDSVSVSANVQNVLQEPSEQSILLSVDHNVIASKNITFQKGESKTIRFSFLPGSGTHTIAVGNHPAISVRVYPLKKVNFLQTDLQTFCSVTARPCEYDYSVGENSYRITARGTDFLHAEDSYGTIFLPKAVTGNFVATVKITELGDKVSDWFRFGIFIRNDLAKNKETGKGTPGSFLVFSTPKRHGAQWDEFGDGSMHNSKSQNYSLDNPFPLWLKMVRSGDKLSGYYSFDGKNWILSRESGNIAGIAKTLDVGLAAGSNDQKPSMVRFEDFRIWVEDK